MCAIAYNTLAGRGLPPFSRLATGWAEQSAWPLSFVQNSRHPHEYETVFKTVSTPCWTHPFDMSAREGGFGSHQQS